MGRFRYSFAGFLLVSAHAFVAMNVARAEPAIQILSLPTYGSAGTLQGAASGVNAADYDVATYVHVEGVGWSTEQTATMNTVPLHADGTFSVPIPNGLDARATIFATALVPKGYAPPVVAAGGRIPAGLNSVALDYQQRYSRTTDFAGYQWGVKESPGGAGPGKNSFSNLPQDVWVDKRGLHLTVNQHDNRWWATEVINTKPLGYGTYVVQTNSPVDRVDPTVAFGAFTWDAFGDDTTGPSANRELDFEDARWGFGTDPTSSQFVVQPFGAADHLVRYKLPDLSADPALTRIMVWTPDGIRFLAVAGHHTATDFAPGDVLAEWDYTGAVPKPGRAVWRFNLWPSSVEVGRSTVPEPATGQAQEVIVSNFLFTSAVPEASSAVTVAAGLGAFVLWSGYRRSRVRTSRMPASKA